MSINVLRGTIGPQARVIRAAVLFVLIMTVALLPPILFVLTHAPLGMSLYNAAGLGINYFQFGFMRRALGGSIAHLLNRDLWMSVLLFYVVSATLFSAIACYIFASLKRPNLVLVAYALVAIELMAFWRADIGRTDLFIAALCALAGFCVSQGRLVLASVIVCLGLATHELGFICGLPIVFALSVAWRKERSFRSGQVIAASAVILFAAVGYVLADQLPHSSIRDVVETIRSELPRTRTVDGALYYALGGSHSLAAGMCVNANDANHLRYLLQAGLLIALCCAALAGRCWAAWLFALLASVPPFVFLWIVGHDMERWVMMSLAGVWIVLALLPTRTIDVQSSSAPLLRVICAVLVFALTYPGPFSEPFPRVTSPLLQRISDELGYPPPPAAHIEFCDPNWLQELTKD